MLGNNENRVLTPFNPTVHYHLFTEVEISVQIRLTKVSTADKRTHQHGVYNVRIETILERRVKVLRWWCESGSLETAPGGLFKC